MIMVRPLLRTVYAVRSIELNVTLTWNTNYVDISTWFKNTYSLNVSTDVNTKIATATMKVDSAEKNQYDSTLAAA